jgi:cytochrome c5
MLKRSVMGLGLAVAGVSYLQAANKEPSRTALQPSSPYRTVLNRYCVTCHNEKIKTAGLALDAIDVENVPAHAEVWEKVIRKLRSGAMPPVGMPRPD